MYMNHKITVNLHILKTSSGRIANQQNKFLQWLIFFVCSYSYLAYADILFQNHLHLYMFYQPQHDCIAYVIYVTCRIL